MQSPSARIKIFDGFTLIELLVVLVVLGILAAIAIPSYQQHLQRSRRAAAQGVLAAVAQAQERYRANNPAYANSFESLGYTPPAGGHYRYTLESSTVPPFVGGYEVHAYPRTDSVQAADAACGDMFIGMSQGQMFYRDRNPASTPAKPVCWPQ